MRETGVIGNSASTSSVCGASGNATNAVFGVDNESFGVGTVSVKGMGATVVFTETACVCITSIGVTLTIYCVDS